MARPVTLTTGGSTFRVFQAGGPSKRWMVDASDAGGVDAPATDLVKYLRARAAADATVSMYDQDDLASVDVLTAGAGASTSTAAGIAYLLEVLEDGALRFTA